MYQETRPPEVDTVITLTRIAGILALVLGVILLIFGATTIIILVGIIPLAVGIIDILIFVNCEEIVKLVETGDYRRAKDKTLLWMILGLLFSLIPGILLLVAYLKYDELLRRTQLYPTPVSYTSKL